MSRVGAEKKASGVSVTENSSVTQQLQESRPAQITCIMLKGVL